MNANSKCLQALDVLSVNSSLQFRILTMKSTLMNPAACAYCVSGVHLSRCVQPEVENFKKLNVISQDEFDTLSPKVPIDPNQEVPTPPMQGESSSELQ